MFHTRYALHRDMLLSQRVLRNLYHIEIFAKNYIEFVVRQIYRVCKANISQNPHNAYLKLCVGFKLI